jgi:hypothetical protein
MEGWRGERGKGCGDGQTGCEGQVILRQVLFHGALLVHESSRGGGKVAGVELWSIREEPRIIG